MKIAICGKMCSGKSHVARYLVKKYNATVYSFASGVKKYAREIFGMAYKNRTLIQDFAEKLKEIDEHVWIRYTMKQIKRESKSHIIIDDLRFPNELLRLQKEGFLVIRLEIDETLQKERIQKTYPNTYREHMSRLKHVSEKGIEQLNIKHTLKVNKKNENKICKTVETLIDSHFFD